MVMLIFKHVSYLFILFSTSSFLCIMIRHNVIFCTKNDSRFMPLTIYSIADDENEFKTIFISCDKSKESVLLMILIRSNTLAVTCFGGYLD